MSGPIGSGKSTLAATLCERYGGSLFKTNGLIVALRDGVERSRAAMQRAGEDLDRESNGRWVGRFLAEKAVDLPEEALVVVDSARILQQIDGIREAFGARVTHVHVVASFRELERRYLERRGKYREFATYAEVQANLTERQIGGLEAAADVVINTDRCTRDDVLARTASALRLLPTYLPPVVDILVGGQYGSEGKGNIVSYLASEYGLLVRVGGPNAGHKVYEEPEPYTFHQLPSGTKHSNADLVIGPGAVLSLDVLLREINQCGVSFDRLSIDPNCIVIEHADIERERQSIKDTIGSTAQGVGVAGARRILCRAACEGFAPVRLAADIEELRRYVRPAVEIFEQAYAAGKKVLLEGTQGTSLSLYHGSYPHVTSRDTTAAGCLAEAGIPPGSVRRVILVCRTYPIRVGNPRRGSSGPMSGKITWKEIADRSGIPVSELNRTERTSTTNRSRRVGEFDWAQLRRGVLLNRPTDIALTFVDYLSIDNRKARRYEQLQEDTIRFIEEVEKVSGVRVSLTLDSLPLTMHNRSSFLVRVQMDLGVFLSECPHLFHMAEAESWDSILKHGLLSTSAILDLFEVVGEQRFNIESVRRASSMKIGHPTHGVAVIRDQNPLREEALADCLQDGLVPRDWYELLNGHVFFWARQHRLDRLLNARLYKKKEHDVLIVDTGRLVERHRHSMLLSPYNSGNTMQAAVPRGKDTFKPIEEYPFDAWCRKRGRGDAIVEVAVKGGVPDIGECVVKVERRRGAEVVKVLHVAHPLPGGTE